jgi:hypothetical protein
MNKIIQYFRSVLPELSASDSETQASLDPLHLAVINIQSLIIKYNIQVEVETCRFNIQG